MTIRSVNVASQPDNPSYQFVEAAYYCDNCHQLSLASRDGSAGSTDQGVVDRWFSATPSSVRWIPKTGVAVTYEDVPQHIASAASEAHECASIGANRAAILMARSVMEASAKANNILKGSLHDKIGALRDAGIIRPLIAEAALGIKDFGNDMAHGDFEQDVSEDDVQETLNLMAVVLSEVFQVDARTKALRERVAARKAEQEVAQ